MVQRLGWIGADGARLDAELDGDFVRLAAHAFFAATQHLKHKVGRELVGDGPLGNRNAGLFKGGPGFIRCALFHSGLLMGAATRCRVSIKLPFVVRRCELIMVSV